MIDGELAAFWGAERQMPQQAMRWSWARAAGALCLRRGLRVLALDGRVDSTACARGFFTWVRLMEPDLPWQRVDPVDHAHFAAGSLLRCLLQAQPLTCSPLPRDGADDVLRAWRAWPEAALLTRLALTLLDGWRRSLGAPALALTLEAQAFDAAHVASYFENLREDLAVAGAFLDSFTGVEPCWRFPTQIQERPAMRRAQALRAAAAGA